MGGYGSTRWGYHTRKTTVEECIRVDLAFILPSNQMLVNRQPTGRHSLFSDGCLVGYSVEYEDAPILLLTYGSAVTRIRMTATYPFNRVPRWWLQCPRCRRRCRCVYKPSYAYGFACRTCHDLSYDARQQTNASRHLEGLVPGFSLLEKAEKLEKRMDKYKYWCKGKTRLWLQYAYIVDSLSHRKR